MTRDVARRMRSEPTWTRTSPLGPRRSRPRAWTPPRRFDGFELVGPLGEGGMGRVYLALERALDRDVALKFIADDVRSERALVRFRREARALARVSHEHVVDVYRLGKVDGRLYIAYEHVDGTPLHALSKISAREVVAIGLGLVRGLEAVHRAGLLHRDVKPSNVVVARGGVVKLLDFGLACFRHRGPMAPPGEPGSAAPMRVTDSFGTSWGTPHYMAPELLRGEPASVASEVYAVGVVLGELAAICREPIDLSPVVERATAAHASDRHASMSAIERELVRLERRATPRPSSPPASKGGGADHVVRACLGVLPNERIGIFRHRADRVAALLDAAVRRAGATPLPVPLDEPGLDIAAVLDRADRTVLIAADGLPPHLSMSLLREAKERSLVHLHVTRADPRLFERSYLADPSILERVNTRVREALRNDRVVRVTSDAGTDLSVALSARYSLMSGDGRPRPGEPQNLPSGYVAGHPARVDGTLVVDGLALGYVRIAPQTLRRAPLVFELEGSRVSRVRGGTPEARELVDRYLESHENAARVGLVGVATNYLVRKESGIDIQDALLPGLGVGLGFTFAEVTRAEVRCPVQLRIHGRDQRVSIEGGPVLVEDGRLAPPLARDIPAAYRAPSLRAQRVTVRTPPEVTLPETR